MDPTEDHFLSCVRQHMFAGGLQEASVAAKEKQRNCLIQTLSKADLCKRPAAACETGGKKRGKRVQQLPWEQLQCY